MPENIAEFLIQAQPGIYREPSYYKEVKDSLSRLGASPEEWAVDSPGDGSQDATIRGWLFRGNPGMPLIVLAHGYQAGRIDMAALCVELSKRGFHAACYDARSHGLSDGRHICFGQHEKHDLDKIARYLSDKVQTQQLILGGLSMGGAMSLLTAEKILAAPSSDLDLLGVSTFSAYWDFQECFERYISLCAPGVRIEIIRAALAKAGELAGFDISEISPSLRPVTAENTPPLLSFHGGLDELIPRSQADAIVANWPGESRLEFIESAGHADILGHPQAMGSFLDFVASLKTV